MSIRALSTTTRCPSSVSYLTLALRNAHNIVRSLSTTSPSLGVVGPESPSYIEVPQPATRVPAWKLPKKGFVPKPRNVLKNSSNRLPKHTPEFLSLVTPEPKHAKVPPADTYGQEKMKYKDELSAARRRNLREGIVELHEKQVAEKEKRREIAERRQRERDELLAKAESDDVKYTLPTIDRHLKESFRPVDKYAKRRLAFRRKRYLKLMYFQRRNKAELIHELYQNAHSFILTETQLDEVIFERFPSTGDAGTKPMMPDGLDVLRGFGFGELQHRQGFINAELDAALTGGTLQDETAKVKKEQEKKIQTTFSGSGEPSDTLGWLSNPQEDFEPKV